MNVNRLRERLSKKYGGVGVLSAGDLDALYRMDEML